MKKILIVATITILANLSCTKMLNQTPVSQISNNSFWKTADDVTGALAGMYADLRSQAINNLFLWGEGRSDALGNNVAAAVFEPWYGNSLNPDNVGTIFDGASTDWIGLYKVIYDCNLILKYTPNIPFTSQSDKNDALAQAYAMRAYIYYVMARTWGGVPIVTSPDVSNAQLSRSTVQDVFQLIKGDIAEAIKLFPDNSFPPLRDMWSLAAVFALRADVYLWTGKLMGGGKADIDTALASCDSVQQANTSLLPNFADVFNYNNSGNNEILFSIRRTFAEDNEPSIYAWMYTIPPFIPNTDSATLASIGVPGGAPYISPSSIADSLYTSDDSRGAVTLTKIYSIDPSSGKKTFYTSIIGPKFNGIVISGVRYFINDYIVYRYAGVLLMKAEAENALGMDPSNEINEVRKRAYGSNFMNHVFVSGTQAQNDNTILNERFKELMFEGKRWWDLIRFGKAFDLVPSLQGRPQNKDLLLFPISTTTLSLNSKLQQNPGY